MGGLWYVASGEALSCAAVLVEIVVGISTASLYIYIYTSPLQGAFKGNLGLSWAPPRGYEGSPNSAAAGEPPPPPAQGEGQQSQGAAHDGDEDVDVDPLYCVVICYSAILY